MEWTYDDGGRRSSRYRGECNDCAVRAIAIATGEPYTRVYKDLTANIRDYARTFSRGKLAHSLRFEVACGVDISPRTGVHREFIDAYMIDLGWRWTPTMHIGSGCKVHLRADELPAGRLVCSLSRHVCAVIDGVIHDTHDPSRNGSRCVYGYWARR